LPAAKICLSSQWKRSWDFVVKKQVFERAVTTVIDDSNLLYFN
jgi:hypothetical protein